MWNELETYKNHFLQRIFPCEKAIVISQMVRKDFRAIQQCRDHCFFPDDPEYRCRFPTNIECNHSTYFDDHAQLAYGWFALPKLMKEMCSDVVLTRWRAINSLSEFLKNPYNAQRAITEFDVVRRSINLITRMRFRYATECFEGIQKMLIIICSLSLYLNGAMKIVSRKEFLKDLYTMQLKKEPHQLKAAQILRNLSEKTQVCLYLLEETMALDHLAEVFTADKCQPLYPVDLWMHLSHFLEIAPERGLEKGFFDLLKHRITWRYPEYFLYDMRCFALLLRSAESQKLFDAIDGMIMMIEILDEPEKQKQRELEEKQKEEEEEESKKRTTLTKRRQKHREEEKKKAMLRKPLPSTYEFVLMVMEQCLMSKWILWRCREFTDLPQKIMKVAETEVKNARTQLYALQILRELGEMPCIKRYMLAHCYESLKSLNCASKLVHCKRDDLVHWLKREIYESDKELKY